MAGDHRLARQTLEDGRRRLTDLRLQVWLANFAQTSGPVYELAGAIPEADQEYRASREALRRLPSMCGFLSTVAALHARMLIRAGRVSELATPWRRRLPRLSPTTRSPSCTSRTRARCWPRAPATSKQHRLPGRRVGDLRGRGVPHRGSRNPGRGRGGGPRSRGRGCRGALPEPGCAPPSTQGQPRPRRIPEGLAPATPRALTPRPGRPQRDRVRCREPDRCPVRQVTASDPATAAS